MYTTEAYLNPQQIIKDQDWVRNELLNLVKPNNQVKLQKPTLWNTQQIKLYLTLFQLYNLIEENAHHHYRQQLQNEKGDQSLSGTWANNMAQLKTQGINNNQLARAVGQLRLALVLTAHPTESKRFTVQEHLQDIFNLLQNICNWPVDKRSQHPLYQEFVGSLEL